MKNRTWFYYSGNSKFYHSRVRWSSCSPVTQDPRRRLSHCAVLWRLPLCGPVGFPFASAKPQGSPRQPSLGLERPIVQRGHVVFPRARPCAGCHFTRPSYRHLWENLGFGHLGRGLATCYLKMDSSRVIPWKGLCETSLVLTGACTPDLLWAPWGHQEGPQGTPEGQSRGR